MTPVLPRFRVISGVLLGAILFAAVPAAELPTAKTPAAGPPAASSQASGAPGAAKAPPMAAKFKQIRERIDALFHHRSESPVPIGPADNPFRPPGPMKDSRAAGGEASPVAEPAGNLALLQQAAATLRVSGIVEIGDRSHVVINNKPYKIGDVVPAAVQGEAVPVRVRAITRAAITLELNEAEVTLKFGRAPAR